MDKANIEELKNDPAVGPMIQDNDLYKIRIVNRGEGLFYYDYKKNKATIVEIQVRNGSIFKESVTLWGDGEQINKDDERMILERLLIYFKNYQGIEGNIR